MATEAQIAANRINAQASCGPRTEEGRACVSLNAVSHGLFSGGDFVRPAEQDLYAEFCAAFRQDLAPEGAIEESLAAEIIHAAWRLRRCSAIEATLVPADDGLDRLLDKTQQSIDRARAQAHRIFHRAVAELRRIQTERRLRIELLPADFDTTTLGLASCKDIAPLLKHRRARSFSPAIEQPFTKQTQSAANQPASTGRNSPCTCGSGVKFKRCCGKGAPAILNYAA